MKIQNFPVDTRMSHHYNEINKRNTSLSTYY